MFGYVGDDTLPGASGDPIRADVLPSEIGAITPAVLE